MTGDSGACHARFAETGMRSCPVCAGAPPHPRRLGAVGLIIAVRGFKRLPCGGQYSKEKPGLLPEGKESPGATAGFRCFGQAGDCCPAALAGLRSCWGRDSPS